MRKIWILMLCLAVLALTACGKLETAPESKPQPSPTELTQEPTVSEPSETEAPDPTETDQWEADIDFSDFETAPSQEQEEVPEPVQPTEKPKPVQPTEPTEPAPSDPETEPEEDNTPVENEPQETLSPTDEENFQRPLVKP